MLVRKSVSTVYDILRFGSVISSFKTLISIVLSLSTIFHPVLAFIIYNMTLLELLTNIVLELYENDKELIQKA